MKVSTGNPDAMPPGIRGLLYGVFCWLNRHIIVLRGIGALLRLWPSFGGRFGLAARAGAVKNVLTRPRSFSNRAHAPNLVAGDYLIAMDPGPTYDADRALLEKRLAGLTVRADADQEARRRVVDLRQPGEKSFDLIDDYLMWIAFHAIHPFSAQPRARWRRAREGMSMIRGSNGSTFWRSGMLRVNFWPAVRLRWPSSEGRKSARIRCARVSGA